MLKKTAMTVVTMLLATCAGLGISAASADSEPPVLVAYTQAEAIEQCKTLPSDQVMDCFYAVTATDW